MPNSNKKMRILRLIALGLVLCICLNVVMAPKAHAISELVIVGAIALTLSAVAAVVILAAEPLGLKEPIMAAAQHGFQSPREFVANLLDRYGASQGLQRFVMLDKFQKGLLITTVGKVLIDNTLSKWLKDFFDWSWSAEGGGLIDFALVSGEIYNNFDISQQVGTITLSGWQNLYAASSCVYSTRSATYTVSGNDISCIVARTSGTSQYNVYVGSKSAGSITLTGTNNTNYTYNLLQTYIDGNPLYYYSLGNQSNTVELVNPPLSIYNTGASSFLYALYVSLYGTSTTIGGEVIEPDTDALTLPAPDAYNSLDVPGALTLPAPISGTTTATNYLEAAADAITAGTGSLEYEDAYGNTQTGTLEGTGEVGLTQVGTQSAELEGAIDIADSVGSETLDNYTIDLKDFFPFCIPFDLRDMLHLLESAPAPVNIEWQFDFGDLGQYELEINLEEWNSVAQTLRTMELLSFCFGLAMLTKRILMGS